MLNINYNLVKVQLGCERASENVEKEGKVHIFDSGSDLITVILGGTKH